MVDEETTRIVLHANSPEDDAFRTDLVDLINRHSRENASETPDFILAEYLAACLDAFDAAAKRRTEWFAAPAPGG